MTIFSIMFNYTHTHTQLTNYAKAHDHDDHAYHEDLTKDNSMNLREREDLKNFEDQSTLNALGMKRKKYFKTFCRIRPHDCINTMYFKFPNDDEEISKLKTVLTVNLPKLVRPTKFYFDETFDEEFTQFEVFRDTCKDLIDKMINDNISSCLISHGMKNSGKTFTIIGDKENPGLLPIAMKYIYNNINDMNGTNKIKLYCNFFEIFNEELTDLLDGKNKIQMPTNYRSNVIKNIYYYPLNNLDDFSNAINIANVNKKLHNGSSLSHTIFKIIIRKHNEDSYDEESSVSLIDLACSDQGYLSLDYFGKNSFCSYPKDDLRFTQYYMLKAIHNTIRYGGLDNRRVPFYQCQLTAYLKYFLSSTNENVVLITNINPSQPDEDNLKVLEFARKFNEFIECTQKKNFNDTQKSSFNPQIAVTNKRACRSNTEYTKMKEKYDQLLQKFEMQNKLIESMLNEQEELAKKNTNDNLVELIEKSIKGLDENNESKKVNVYILNPFIRNLCLNSYDKTDKRKYHLVGDKHFISSTTTKESITGHLVNSYKKALSCKRHVKEVQNFDLQLEEFDKFSDKSSNKTSAIKLRAKSMDDKRKKGRLMINEYDSTNHIENSFIKENTNLLNWPKFAKFHKSQTEKTFKTKKLSIVKANTSGKRKKQIK